MKNPILKTLVTRHKYFLLAAVILLVSYGIAQFIIHEKFEDLRADMQLQISEQENLLVTIAETTARNGADEVTESVVRDCVVSERTEFDTLLGRLDAGLSTAELTKLERLFGRCGNFFAQRKALMTVRLERELQAYEVAVKQLEIVAGENAVEEYQVTAWQQLVESEKVQSERFTTLVQFQDQIVAALLSGKRADSDEIKTIMQQAQETQQSMIVASKQAADLRTELLSI